MGLLLEYDANLALVMLSKARGESIKDSPAIGSV